MYCVLFQNFRFAFPISVTTYVILSVLPGTYTLPFAFLDSATTILLSAVPSVVSTLCVCVSFSRGAPWFFQTLRPFRNRSRRQLMFGSYV